MNCVDILRSFVVWNRRKNLSTNGFFGMLIAIGSDHAGFFLKQRVKDLLLTLGHEPIDHGTHSAESVDYPDYAHLVAESVESGRVDFGIVICGSGNGVSMTVNKHAAIRAVLSWIPEIARLGRAHNDANILALPARFIEEELALQIVDTFLRTPFAGGRHCTRVEKISPAPNR